MKQRLLTFRFLFIAVISVLLTCNALADNGIIPITFSNNGGTGGAGAALPLDANNADTNPALLGQMINHWTLNSGVNYQKTSANTSGAPGGNHAVGNQRNILPYAPYGAFGFCYRPNECWAIGIGGSGGGSHTKYNRAISGNTSDGLYNRRFSFGGGLILPTVAYNVSCNQSYGFSLILGVNQVKTDLAVPTRTFPAPETSGNFVASYALGIGARIGGFWVLTDWLNLGASLSSPVFFQKNTKYNDVLRHPFNFPAIARIGVDLHIGDCTHLVIDFREIFYKNVKAFGDQLGWRNQSVFMIGLRQNLTCNLIGSIGYNYGRSPIREDNVLLNSLIPAIIEHHFTAGIQYNFNPFIELTLGGLYSLPHTLTDNGTGILGPIAKGAVLKSQEWGGNAIIVVKY